MTDHERALRKAILEIIQNPSLRKVDCPNCGGHGFRITGAISTKNCETCSVGRWESRGKVNRRDHPKTTDRIIAAIIKSECACNCDEMITAAVHEVYSETVATGGWTDKAAAPLRDQLRKMAGCVLVKFKRLKHEAAKGAKGK